MTTTMQSRRPSPRAGRTEEPHSILSIRARIDDREATRFIHDALAEIRVFMHERDVEPAGPPFSLRRSAGQRGIVDIEAGWPLERPIGGSGRVHGGALPASLARNRSGEM
jgi:hypothetical protein